MSDEDVKFNHNDPINMSFSLDLNFFLLAKIVELYKDRNNLEKMGVINSLLENWETRLVNQQRQMNKVNAHALVQSNDVTEDVADILMDIHSIGTDTVRKEFKRFVRQLLRRSIEGEFDKGS